jgi:hypothetical protein
MRIFIKLGKMLPTLTLVFLTQCDGLHTSGESQGKSQKIGVSDLEADSCDVSDEQCQEEIQTHLATLQAKIEPMILDKTCVAQSECKAVQGYGYCPSIMPISVRQTSESQLKLLITDYQSTLLRLPQPKDCSEVEVQTAQCVSRQCVLTPIIDTVGENIGMLARKLGKLIVIDDVDVVFLADGKLVYSDSGFPRESDAVAAALRDLASKSACDLTTLEEKTSPVTREVTESEVASLLSCLGSVRFE